MGMKAERSLEPGLLHENPGRKRTVITPTISSLALLKVSLGESLLTCRE